MSMTNEKMVETLQSVISLLKVEDDEKVALAVDILTLLINYIGAQNIMDALGDGLGSVMDTVSDFLTGESVDLSAEERGERLAITRAQLDALFEKMAVVG